MPIGPEFSAHLQPPPADQADEEEEDEDSYVPALPPHLLASRSKPKTTAPTVPTKKPSSPPPPPPSVTKAKAGGSGKVQGPAFPPGFLADDDSDDDIGPRPPPPSGFASVGGKRREEERDFVKEFMEKEENRRRNLEEKKNPTGPLKREEWMLVPPSASELLGKLDPTKLSKPRQFSTSTHSSSSRHGEDMSLWTETPAERQKRLADEVSGKRPRATATSDADTSEPSDKRRKIEEESIRASVEEHTRKYRGPSLIDMHKERERKRKEADSDEETGESKIWEHGRDMSIGGRLMDDSKRDKMIKESRSLGSRFGKSSFL